MDKRHRLGAFPRRYLQVTKIYREESKERLHPLYEPEEDEFEWLHQANLSVYPDDYYGAYRESRYADDEELAAAMVPVDRFFELGERAGGTQRFRQHDADAERLVYFIQEGIDGHIKIGSSNAPEDRLRELQVGNPRRLAILATESGGRQREKQLHARFGHLAMGGEWFRAGNDLVEYVRALECA